MVVVDRSFLIGWKGGKIFVICVVGNNADMFLPDTFYNFVGDGGLTGTSTARNSNNKCGFDFDHDLIIMASYLFCEPFQQLNTKLGEES